MNPQAYWPRAGTMFAVLLSLGFAGSVYIDVAMQGRVWVAPALEASFVIWAISFLLGIVVACKYKSWKHGLIVVGLNGLGYILFMLVGFLCIGSHRIANCGWDGSMIMGYVNPLIILWMVENLRAAMLLAFPFSVFFVLGFSHAYWVVPLRWDIRMTDLANVCLISADTHDSHLDRAERIRHSRDFEMTWIVGEHAPRLYRFVDGKMSRWVFSEHGFGREWQPDSPPRVCAAQDGK